MSWEGSFLDPKFVNASTTALAESPASSARQASWAVAMRFGTPERAGMPSLSRSARNWSSWFGSAAATPPRRIAAPVSTTMAATREPAWVVMPVNMAGVSFLLGPKVERPCHRLTVLLPEQRFDVALEHDRLAWAWWGHRRGGPRFRVSRARR